MSTVAAPSFSADWRFLLPLVTTSRILIIGAGQADLRVFFEKLGMQVETCHPADLPSPQNQPRELSASMRYDAILIPGGISSNLAVYRQLRGLLNPDGVLLLGFYNPVWALRGTKPERFYNTHWWIVNLLRWAGYRAVAAYGAMPNTSIPEYIFPLDTYAPAFVLEHRYWHRLPVWALRLITLPGARAMLTGLLPAYFVIAYAAAAPVEAQL